MKTAIYARKSTFKYGQKETIENQIKICKRRAKELGLTIVDVKQDTGTGTTDNNRDEIKELIKGAMDGKYECVIMKGISRFYRDVEHGLGLIKKLDRSKIRVITVEENFDSFERRTANGQLDTSMLTMYLMFSENESKKTSDRIKHTQLEKAHAGEWNQAGSPPYGYKYDAATKKLVIDTVSAEVVKLIFRLYTDGMGMKSIAMYLNGDNPTKTVYPSSKGKLWSQYTIGFMLKNRVYCGDVVFNKRSKTSRPYKNPTAIGKTDDDVYIGNDYNDKSKWIIKEDAHDGIITREEFDVVQNIINQKGIRTGVKNDVSLLASIAKCGKCGKGMTFKRGRKNNKGQVVTKNNYYCSNYIKYGKLQCDSHHLGADELEEYVINDLKSMIINFTNNKEATSGVKNPKSDKDILQSKIRKIEDEISTISNKTDSLLEKNLEGSISDAQFSRLNEKYSKEMDVLVVQLEKLKTEEVKVAENESQESSVAKLFKKVINIEKYDKEKQRYILYDLLDKIVVTDGMVDIHYKFNYTKY